MNKKKLCSTTEIGPNQHTPAIIVKLPLPFGTVIDNNLSRVDKNGSINLIY